MKLATWTAGLLFALTVSLSAQGGKCATCNGKGDLGCFGCGGKGAFDAACALCSGHEAVLCPNCAGKGKVTCGKCGGTSVTGPSQEANMQNCQGCKGRGTLPCRVCVKGKLRCGGCKGTQKAPHGCPVCVGKKRLACPDCGSSARGGTCAACAGEKKEACPVCQGTKKVPGPCMICHGSGGFACNACLGLGVTMCQACDLVGHGNTGICTKCRGKVAVPCAACRGTATSTCEGCAGKGGERDCSTCLGKGTIDCRRCAEPSKMWTAKDDVSGVRVTVLPVAPFEPHLLAGLQEALPTSQPVLWRVVIDARESKSPWALGTADGWQIAGTEPNDRTCALGPSFLAKDQEERYVDLLFFCGLGKEGGKYPVTVSPSRVGTTLLWEKGDPDADMKGFTLRQGGTELYLEEGPAAWTDWVRLMAAAGKYRK